MKAILLIDMPTCCEDCPCYQPEMNYDSIDYHFCGVDGHIVGRNDLPNDSCPLKPLRENYISVDWLKQNIPFQHEEDQSILLSMLESWRKHE